MGLDTGSVNGFALDVPLSRVLGIADMDVPEHIEGRLKKLEHEVLHHIHGKPGGSQPDGDLTGGQIHRLDGFQCFQIGSKGFRLVLCQGWYLRNFSRTLPERYSSAGRYLSLVSLSAT